MPRTITIETYQEFDTRHGNNGLHCGETNLVVWSDGASVRADDADMRSEPPTDPKELLRIRRLYRQEALRRAENEFTRTQNDFANAAALASRYSNLPGPPANAKEILQGLASRVHRERSILASIEKKLTENPSEEAQRIQQYQESLAKNRAKAGEMLREITAVTI
jgi:hypothetical protein